MSKATLLETMSQIENQIINELLCFLLYQGVLLGWCLALPITPCGKRNL